MFFFKKKGKQFLDMTGNLILSHNDKLIKASSKSAMPYAAYNSKNITNLSKLSFKEKLYVTVAAIRFIWGKSNALGVTLAERLKK
jgi:hypothetical protein